MSYSKGVEDYRRRQEEEARAATKKHQDAMETVAAINMGQIADLQIQQREQNRKAEEALRIQEELRQKQELQEQFRQRIFNLNEQFAEAEGRYADDPLRLYMRSVILQRGWEALGFSERDLSDIQDKTFFVGSRKRVSEAVSKIQGTSPEVVSVCESYNQIRTGLSTTQNRVQNARHQVHALTSELGTKRARLTELLALPPPPYPDLGQAKTELQSLGRDLGEWGKKVPRGPLFRTILSYGLALLLMAPFLHYDRDTRGNLMWRYDSRLYTVMLIALAAPWWAAIRRRMFWASKENMATVRELTSRFNRLAIAEADLRSPGGVDKTQGHAIKGKLNEIEKCELQKLETARLQEEIALIPAQEQRLAADLKALEQEAEVLASRRGEIEVGHHALTEWDVVAAELGSGHSTASGSSDQTQYQGNTLVAQSPSRGGNAVRIKSIKGCEREVARMISLFAKEMERTGRFLHTSSLSFSLFGLPGRLEYGVPFTTGCSITRAEGVADFYEEHIKKQIERFSKSGDVRVACTDSSGGTISALEEARNLVERINAVGGKASLCE